MAICQLPDDGYNDVIYVQSSVQVQTFIVNNVLLKKDI